MGISEVLLIMLIVFGIALAITWLILPFTVMAMKKTMLDLLVEARRMNELLKRLAPPRG